MIKTVPGKDDPPPEKPKTTKARHYIFLFFGSLLWYAAVIVVGGEIISGLERPARGESVLVPWSICIGTTLTVLVLPLLSLSVLLPKTTRGKIIGLVVVLTALFMADFVLGGIPSLEKAWRRGW